MSGHHKWDDVRRTAPDHDAARWGVGVPPGHETTNTTAPDQPGLPEPDPQAVDPQWLNGLHQIKSREPAPDQLPGSPTPGSNDLRDRIAEALVLHLNGPASDGRGWYRTGADRIDCYARADAVMAVVQPELDAKDLEIAEAHDALMANLKRAETAEAERDTARAEAAEERLNDIREEGRDL